MSIPCIEPCLINIFLFDFDLIVAQLEVYLCKNARTMQTIQQFINPWDRILILDSALIQATIINAQAKGTILFAIE